MLGSVAVKQLLWDSLWEVGLMWASNAQIYQWNSLNMLLNIYANMFPLAWESLMLWHLILCAICLQQRFWKSCWWQNLNMQTFGGLYPPKINIILSSANFSIELSWKKCVNPSHYSNLHHYEILFATFFRSTFPS